MQPSCLSTCLLSPADWHSASSLSAALACRHGYERELLSLLSQLVRDMNRKIEKQKERAVLESGARQLTMEDRARLEAIKVRACLELQALQVALFWYIKVVHMCDPAESSTAWISRLHGAGLHTCLA